MVDKDGFFREVTLRICSSLDINTALERVFDHMREHVPLNQLYLSIIDINLMALRIIAGATDGSKAHERVIPLPKEIIEHGRKAEYHKPFIMTASHPDPDIRAAASHYNIAGNSALVVPLWVEDKNIGFLTLRASGEDCFTSDHIELLAVVARPVAIALVNALAHEALLKQRDILIDDNRFLNKELLSPVTDGIIGANSGLRNVMEMVRHVAPQNTSVLIIGETGTGKEGIANAVHFASPRKDGPFVKINCGAISENLIDDELFGHEKGAFTGAVTVKRGRFERASGGTFFLDEIGELPLQSQVRLLRVLQSKMISRVGGEKPIPVDVRIIAATNRDLRQMVADGRFREDLWFRLNIFPITVPPLRQRNEDIPALIRYFVAQKCRELSIARPPVIAPGAYERLMGYRWPGNVRELENLVERELIWHREGQLKFDSLLPDNVSRETATVPAGQPEGPLNLDEATRILITKVLKMAKGKIHGPGGAAELLGINPNTLRGRMSHLGIPYGHKSGQNKLT